VTSLDAGAGVTALTPIAETMALGYADGSVELYGGAEARGTVPFVGLPSAAVTRLLSGPQGTLIAGHANGEVGLYSLDNGRQLLRAKLHGPISHLLLADRQLYALSSLGRTLWWDLGDMSADYCSILREVWSRVPVAWERGHPVPRPAPADHRCAR
jgi:hypothetical protein